MSGYHEYSKSNNALAAEANGRCPASKIAKQVGVPAKFVKDKCAFATHNEYHHTSKYYNATDYYHLDEIHAWVDGDPDTVEDRGETFKEALTAWRAAEKARKTAEAIKTYTDCSVKWLEWGGTRNRPHATERAEDNCTIQDAGGKFVTVLFKSGVTMKKGRDTNGFEVIGADGRRIWL